MNASHEPRAARGLSASSEARQMMAEWLRITQATKNQTSDDRTFLMQRYPSGLINEAEIDALLTVLRN